MNGTHVVAEFYQCTDRKMLTDQTLLRNACRLVVESAKFNIVGEAWHSFPSLDGEAPGGVTGTLLLAESHLAIHTWPETGIVTADLYTCNVSRDNSQATHTAMSALSRLLGSGIPVIRSFERNSIFAKDGAPVTFCVMPKKVEPQAEVINHG